MKIKFFAYACWVVVVALEFLFPTSLFSQADFYQGKTVTMIQAPRQPGGLGNLRVRVLMPFLH